MSEASGSTIQQLRTARGWTLSQLATAAGVDAGYIGRIERGERQATRYFLNHLMSVLSDSDASAGAA